MTSNRLAAILLVLVLAAGSYVRLAQLARDNFDVDEFFQYYAAQSLVEGEGPRLPSGRPYLRGIEVTHMVALSTEAFGPSPLAARLPSALLGVAGLMVFAVVLWALGGPWVAFWGTLLLAIYPEAIDQARQLRFYTYQLLFGIVALYTGWRTVRDAGATDSPSRRRYLEHWLWAVVTFVALYLAFRAQVTTLSVAVGWGLCVALAGSADLARRGMAALRRSVPLQLTLAGIALVLVALIASPETVITLARRSQEIPLWAVAQGANHPLAYYYALVANYPILVSLAPLIFIVVALRQPRLAIYLFLWFSVPLILHSFVFPWKQQRFVMLALPALFTASAIAAARGSGLLFRSVRLATRQFSAPEWTRTAVAAAVVGVVAAGAILTTPATNRAAEQLAVSELTDRWSEQAEILDSLPALQDVPVGGWRPLPTLYYLDRVDFVVTRTGLESEMVGELDDRSMSPVGSLDDDAGVPVLTTPSSIRRHFEDEGAVLISTEAGYEINGEMNPELVRVLRTQAKELCKGECGRLRLYYWDFDERGPQPAVADSESVRTSSGIAQVSREQ